MASIMSARSAPCLTRAAEVQATRPAGVAQSAVPPQCVLGCLRALMPLCALVARGWALWAAAAERPGMRPGSPGPSQRPEQASADLREVGGPHCVCGGGRAGAAHRPRAPQGQRREAAKGLHGSRCQLSRSHGCGAGRHDACVCAAGFACRLPGLNCAQLMQLMGCPFGCLLRVGASCATLPPRPTWLLL
jgi:hypothetical protein